MGGQSLLSSTSGPDDYKFRKTSKFQIKQGINEKSTDISSYDKYSSNWSFTSVNTSRSKVSRPSSAGTHI